MNATPKGLNTLKEQIMLLKKFYIPIGALLIASVVIAFFALRSDVPDEPIVIYKTTTPLRARGTPPSDVVDTTENASVTSTAEMSFDSGTIDTSMPDLDGLSSHEKQHVLEARLAEAQGIIKVLEAKIEGSRAEREALRASERETERKRAALKILNQYKEWLDVYNAEGDDLSAFAAYYNQNPAPTEAEETYADYVRKRQAERPMEFLTTTNALPLPYREQYIRKYHANLVRDIGLEAANKIFTID